MLKLPDSQRSLLILVAFAAISIIWGTTYLAMRVAVETLPPFFLSGIRFLLAGTITLAILKWRGCPSPTRLHWTNAALIGGLLVIGGNGLTMWAVQEIPSGVAAVVVATMPIWMALFDWLFYQGPRPTKRVVAGMTFGLAGIVLLVRPDQMLGETESLHVPSLLALFAAPIFWSTGSLHSRRVELPSNIFMTTAIESICGGAGLMLFSLLLGETRQLDLSTASTNSLLATLYLAFFGSLVALSAYSWLLKNVSASKVSSYTFVNPVIAVFLGWLVLNEPTPWWTIFSVLLIVSAVILIITRPSRPPKAKPSQLR